MKTDFALDMDIDVDVVVVVDQFFINGTFLITSFA